MVSPLCIELVFLILDEEETLHKEHEQRTSYTDAKSARVINMFAEVKRLLELTPVFTQKLQFPNLPNSRLRTPINRRLGKSKVLRSAKAKLHFPFGRLDRFIKHRMTNKQTPIFITAVLECLANKEVLKGAGNSAKQSRRRVIRPKHIQHAMRNNKGLSKLLAGVTISGAALQPII